MNFQQRRYDNFGNVLGSTSINQPEVYTTDIKDGFISTKQNSIMFLLQHYTAA